ncbi:LIC_10091 family protein [Paraliomyxa miuraensis]|uniref:LIC_10091 family protein n=1 Tax=Paraliomyxa miuraensis TaxID=376150 RepID=UPI002257216F|nr:hypothetical protein [Paraliomyxa miuraensis]MCX4245096.1 hypothetical protein [Paraliomyxa miuraensis]
MTRSIALPLLLLLACAPRGGAVPPSDAPVSAASPPAASTPTAPSVVTPPAEPRSEAKPEPVSLRVQGPGPLSDAQLRVLHGSPEDDVPERRNGILKVHEEEHYISGNERTLDLFHSTIADVGGGYVGVGTDQGYLLVDWARSDIAWFIDYDPEVLVVHEIYRRFLLGAASPEEFLALWERDGRDRAEALLRAEASDREAEQLVEAYRSYREEIRRRLGKVKARMEHEALPCYLGDLSRYEHLRQMVEQGRVRSMLANLLDDEALAGIAEAARTLEVPIRVLYLSNAEQYWKRYSPQYRSNIASLPLHGDAVLLRTLLRVSIDKDFHYGTQPATNYVEWLSAPYVRNVYDITGRPEYVKGELSFFTSEGDPSKTWLAKRWRNEHPDEAEGAADQ